MECDSSTHQVQCSNHNKVGLERADNAEWPRVVNFLVPNCWHRLELPGLALNCKKLYFDQVLVRAGNAF